jgi:cyanophycin synthetase
VLAEADRRETLASLDRVPMTHGGRVGFQMENVLAAVAAAWALGVPLETIAAGLQSFTGDAGQVPGRFNVLDAGGATVIVDYAHNASALRAVVAAIEEFPQRRRSVVFCAFNRNDDEVVQLGRILGDAFDRVVLYQDYGNRDRADGELNRLLRRGLAEGRRDPRTVEQATESAAIETALSELQPGDLLIIGTEAIDSSLEHVQRLLADRVGRSG